MPPFLSPEWMRRADALLAGADDLSVPGDPFTIEQTVTGGPDEPVRYHLRFDEHGARLHPGPADDPTVTLAVDRSVAAAVARGEVSAQAAFQNGDIRVGGDMQQLIAHRAQITTSDDVLGPLRADTQWDDA